VQGNFASRFCQELKKRKGLTAAEETTVRLKRVVPLLLERRLLAFGLDDRGVASLIHEGHAEVQGQALYVLSLEDPPRTSLPSS